MESRSRMAETSDFSMDEYIYEAREELKRVEHIIYVSLKYTRTTDVIRNAVLRLVSFFDMMIDAFMIDAQEKGLIDKIPKSPALKANELAERYADNEQLQKYLCFYFFLKDLLKRDYLKINEYRRHVGMVFDLENCSTVINIDSLETCQYYAFEFYIFANRLLGLVKEGDDD